MPIKEAKHLDDELLLSSGLHVGQIPNSVHGKEKTPRI
jgi:hypothetical protein